MSDADILHFPVERMTDRVIVEALLPHIRQAARELGKADAEALADAACRLLDPEGVSPPLVREGCREALLSIARDWLAKS